MYSASVLDSSRFQNYLYTQVLDAAPELAKLATRLAAGETGTDLRRDAGLVLFDVQELWRCALRVARARSVAFEVANFADVSAVSPADAAIATAERDFGALETALAGPTLDLDRIWATLQPHYDGNALAEALDATQTQFRGVSVPPIHLRLTGFASLRLAPKLLGPFLLENSGGTIGKPLVERLEGASEGTVDRVLIECFGIEGCQHVDG